MSNDFLTPKAKEHWESLRKHREKYGPGACACPLCELIPELESLIRRAKVEAYEEGFMNAHEQHATEDQLLGRPTQKILLSNPYKEEK